MNALTVLTALLSLPVNAAFHPHIPRADCKTRTVESGDGCGTLATKCGISAADFTKYNSKLDCSKLAPGQWVCCSSGTLPSRRPSQNADGSCYAIDVVSGTTCTGVSATYDITMDEINKWNTKTWRWTGCGGLQPGMRICGSTGTPPLPKTNSTIPCGLESPGNKECPLNGCCGKWGFCGITEEFCTVNKTGAPGTGCQSNCQLLSEFDNVGKATANSGRNIIGYYSNWAAHRSCDGVPDTVLPAQRPKDLDPFSFTHIVYSFGYITRGDWKLTTTQSDDDELIKELQGLKKQNPNLKTMWAIGGWAFNDPPYQDIFSTMARTSSSRAAFIKNALSQLSTYGFDGIDIDWEYPGTERGGVEGDGKNFLSLMKELQAAIKASGKRVEVSFTAPASYWYLQQFPIKELQDYTDWINLMTYDIHGSWDIKFNTGVLPHTAIPEVNQAVNMMLKAGVRMGKINLGIGFYGRSFTLSNPSCNVAGCPMSGPGIKGPCTKGEGFLSYGEINHLIQTRGLKPEYNATSQTMTLKYDNQWIGYENPDTISKKLEFVLKRAMPGVLIWATDLDRNNNLLSAVVGKSLAQLPASTDCPADGVLSTLYYPKELVVLNNTTLLSSCIRALRKIVTDNQSSRTFKLFSHETGFLCFRTIVLLVHIGILAHTNNLDYFRLMPHTLVSQPEEILMSLAELGTALKERSEREPNPRRWFLGSQISQAGRRTFLESVGGFTDSDAEFLLKLLWQDRKCFSKLGEHMQWKSESDYIPYEQWMPLETLCFRYSFYSSASEVNLIGVFCVETVRDRPDPDEDLDDESYEKSLVDTEDARQFLLAFIDRSEYLQPLSVALAALVLKFVKQKLTIDIPDLIITVPFEHGYWIQPIRNAVVWFNRSTLFCLCYVP
ncbi:glycoside hydrolase family 18 protein, partial [Rhizoctonia solani AG-3 Rhs1AP]